MAWYWNPHTGGKKIPPAVQERVRQRILAHANRKYKGRFVRLDVRFRGRSATSTPTWSRPCRAECPGIGAKRASKCASGCSTRHCICAVCDSRAMKRNGVSRSTPTAMSGTSHAFLTPAMSTARRKRLSTLAPCI